MIKRKQNVSINILAVLVLLLSVLLLSIGVGNAWFSSSQDKGIKISVKVNEFNVALYQVITVNQQETLNEVYTYRKNDREATSKYITLTQMLQPEEEIDLKFKLVNNDAGSAVYLRYGLKLYACGVDEDTNIPINVALGEDFIQNGDYFYYVDSQDAYKTFAKTNEIILCTGFTVPYSSFSSLNGGETVRVELIIQCVNQSNEF